MQSPSYATSHSRWIALSKRDPAAHCSFFYGVKSTKIYCRPTCTARLARRANVVFYDTTDDARRDGFRSCQRCKPDDVAFVGQREETVMSALNFLRTEKGHADATSGLKDLAKQVGVTPSYLCRAFKQTMGTTVGEYMRQFEINSSRETPLEPSITSTTNTPDSLTTSPDPSAAGSSSRHSIVSPTCRPMSPVNANFNPVILDDEALRADSDINFGDWICSQELDPKE